MLHLNVENNHIECGAVERGQFFAKSSQLDIP